MVISLLTQLHSDIVNKMVILLMFALLGNEGLSGACAFLSGKYLWQPSTKSISGIVVDKGGYPLGGCSVVIKGTSSNTVTDVCGEFILPVEDREFTIVFQSMSYEDQKTFEWRLSASEVTVERIVFQIGRSKIRNKTCKKEPGKKLKKIVID